MRKIGQQNFEINVTADDANYKETDFKFDSRAKKILGFLLTSKRLDQVDLRGSFEMQIDKKPIFPEGTDAKQFTCNASVPVDKKIYWFKDPIDAGDLSLMIDWRSDTNALAAFAAYKVKFQFIYEYEA